MLSTSETTRSWRRIRHKFHRLLRRRKLLVSEVGSDVGSCSRECFTCFKKGMWHTISVCLCCFAESATKAISLAPQSVSHALKSMWNTFSVRLPRSAESATEVISLALHSVSHALKGFDNSITASGPQGISSNVLSVSQSWKTSRYHVHERVTGLRTL